METNINDIETFIFIHDQDILLDFIGKNKFTDIHNLKWVFLGHKPVDKIQTLSNLIIARELPINIEQYPKLTSFTGWYALYKNDLLKSKYVNLFEYDIKYIPEFVDINKEMLSKDFDFIGYFPMSILDIVYIKELKYSRELIDSVKNKTNFDIIDLINNLPQNTKWSSSSNSTWRVDSLIKYLEWIMQFIDDIKESNFSGHIHERSISFFYFMENLNVKLTQGLMFHAQLNSHGTSPLPPERAKQMYNLL